MLGARPLTLLYGLGFLHSSSNAHGRKCMDNQVSTMVTTAHVEEGAHQQPIVHHLLDLLNGCPWQASTPPPLPATNNERAMGMYFTS